jgi:hypothetical protein
MYWKINCWQPKSGGPKIFVSGLRLATSRLQELTHQHIYIISKQYGYHAEITQFWTWILAFRVGRIGDT